MTDNKMSPLPWKYDGDGFDSESAIDFDTDGYTVMTEDCEPICEIDYRADDSEAEANAQYIVEACNNYTALKEQNTRLREAIEGLQSAVNFLRKRMTEDILSKMPELPRGVLDMKMAQAQQALTQEEQK